MQPGLATPNRPAGCPLRSVELCQAKAALCAAGADGTEGGDYLARNEPGFRRKLVDNLPPAAGGARLIDDGGHDRDAPAYREELVAVWRVIS